MDIIELVTTACVSMYIARAAELDGDNSMLWFAITLAACFFSMLLPAPFFRILFAGFVVYGVKFIVNLRK